MRETREQCLTITQRLLCQLRYFGELHFSSNSNTNKYFNVRDYCWKLSHQIIHPFPDAFLSNIQPSLLQLQCCDVSLWIIPLTEGRSNAAAAVKHRMSPAPRISGGAGPGRAGIAAAPGTLQETLINPCTRLCLMGYGIRITHLGPPPPRFSPNSWSAATLAATQKHWKWGCAAQGRQASPKVQLCSKWCRSDTACI